MRVTLQDVASAVDMSVSTVSRALNSHPAISPASTSKVRRVAAKMNYQRPQSHRYRVDAVSPLTKKNIAVVPLGMDRSLVALPAVASSLAGVEAALSQAGANVLLGHVPDLQFTPPNLKNNTLDGVILAGASQGDRIARASSPLLDRLRQLPSVWVLCRPVGCCGDAVVSNDFATGSMAAEYLIAQGHRRLAFVNPKPDHLLFMRREDGFVATARRLGAEVQSFCESPPEGWQLPLKPPLHVEAVQKLVDDLLAASPRPTAVFAAADSVATLVYRALSVRKLRVGRDMSIISGNNDYSLIAGLHPNLTTFDIHAHELGRLAVRQLAMRMAERDQRPDTELMIEPTLVEGGSVVTIDSPILTDN